MVPDVSNNDTCVKYYKVNDFTHSFGNYPSSHVPIMYVLEKFIVTRSTSGKLESRNKTNSNNV